MSDRLPYLMREKTRHGTVVWYVRIGDGPRTRIRGEYGSREFKAAYQRALAGKTAAAVAERREKASHGSLRWLVTRYRESSAWTKLGDETRRTREGVLRQLEENDRPYTSITKKDIRLGVEARAAKPSVANHFLKTVRGLFKWALEADLIPTDPTEGVSQESYETDGFHVWTEEEVQAFEARWPVGTRERLAMAVMLYAGLRRGDAARLGKQHIKNGVIDLKTEKTGAWVSVPIMPPLAAIMKATKTGDLALVATAKGRPMQKRSFGAWFKEACVAAGVPGSCHGLRKAGATRLAEAGATIHELNAIFGWTGTTMASLYTETADKKRLAASAIAKLRKNAR